MSITCLRCPSGEIIKYAHTYGKQVVNKDINVKNVGDGLFSLSIIYR